MSGLSRRSLVTVDATQPVLTVPSVAANIDPVYAAIERRKTAYAEHGRAIKNRTATDGKIKHGAKDSQLRVMKPPMPRANSL